MDHAIIQKPDEPSSREPLIGITCRWDEGRKGYDLPAEYAEAVASAGGVPVLIPLVPEQAAALLARLDGLILCGSPSDVDPARYGAARHASVTNVAAPLDSTCFALLDHAERLALPVLGICYGMQVINVHRGGTLIQNIPDAVPSALRHQNREGRHDVGIVEGTRLAAWAGSPTQSVNSTHHQAVDQPGRDLRISARAADGIIEAMEYTLPGRFLIAVQWHPERIWRKSELSARLFQMLLQAARAFTKE